MLSFFVAKRYLFSRRIKNFIHVISFLSIVGVAFTTAALIVILSVFNGLGDLLRSLNNAFDPEIKIEAKVGKSFKVDEDLINKLSRVPGVSLVTPVIEDYAYVRYGEANQVVIIKGMDNNFIGHHRLDNSIVQGKMMLSKDSVPYAIIGRGIQYSLRIDLENDLFPLQVFYIKNPSQGISDPSKLYTRLSIMPGAIFSIMQYFDENYIIVPLEFAKALLQYGDKRTAIEIKAKAGENLLTIQRRLQNVLGDGFKVLNQEEQHKDLYRILKVEKLFAFLALALLIGIGSISIFFSLMMLALDKRKDIAILSSLGASETKIRNVFLMEGAMISLIGTFSGLALGAFFCWAQGKYALISMGMETSVSDGYPVKMILSDFIFTFLTVSVITFLVSLWPARKASKFPMLHYL